jgi:hypothetical protein
MAVSHERAAMATCELFGASVAVVDNQQESLGDALRNRRDPLLRDERDLNSLTGFGVNAMAVEEIEFVGSAWQPDLAQAVVLGGDMKFALRSQYLDWQRVEEFVGEDEQGRLGRASALDESGGALRDLVTFA